MSRKILPLVLLAALACFFDVAHARDLSAARRVIEAQYGRLDEALGQKHPTPLASIAAPDLQITSASGITFDLAAMTKAWQEAAASFETLTVRTVVESVAEDGPALQVVVRIVQEGTIKQMGAAVPFRAESAAHDSWVRIGTDWRLHRSVETSARTWIDGTLIQDAKAPPPLLPAQRGAIVAELRTRLVPFKTVAPGSGFDDLAALDAIVGDARIVALGEATHGSAEFFRMKHRIFEYLVEKKGFTVFAFETNWPDVETVNRYVQKGEGAAASAIKSIFGVWRTQEVLGLIEWMRAYNGRPGRTKMLSFTGFDMQAPESAARCVIDAISRLGSADAEAARGVYEGIGALYERLDAFFSTNPLTDAEKSTLRTKAATGLKLLEERREALLKVLGPAELRRAHRCATIVVQASAPGAETTAEIGNARDLAMAENIKWLAEEAYPGEKIAIWAHNGHVAAGVDAKGTVSMGVHLRKAFGSQLRILGFALDRGQTTAVELKEGKPSPKGSMALTVPEARAGTPEALLREAGLPRAMLDLRSVPPAGALGKWLAEPLPMRSIGWAFDPETVTSHYETFVLPEAFDALIFIEETTATMTMR